MLSEQEIKSIKQQLIQQIDSTFPEEKKELAKQQVESMNKEQLEEFLKQNNLLKNDANSSSQEQQSIFRSIVDEKVPSYKIDENKEAIAVLEINPISKGHIILIPKKTVSTIDKMPQNIFSLAKKISKQLKTKLKPKEVAISSANIFGEFIVNILPIYENESLNSERYKAEKEELEKLQSKLKKKEKPKTIKKPAPKKLIEFKLPKRIP